MAAKRKKFSGIDPDYLKKQQALLRRSHRKTVFFNTKEIEAIDEYCRRFKIQSRSALIRQAVMERVLKTLDETHPTLF